MITTHSLVQDMWAAFRFCHYDECCNEHLFFFSFLVPNKTLSILNTINEVIKEVRCDRFEDSFLEGQRSPPPVLPPSSLPL